MVWYLTWDKGRQDEKYKRPAEMLDLMRHILNEVLSLDDRRSRVFYLDSRFSSWPLMQELIAAGQHAIMSFATNRKIMGSIFKYAMDKNLGKMEVKNWRLYFLVRELEGRQWESVGFSLVVQAKKNTVLKLLATHGAATPADYVQRRRKPFVKGKDTPVYVINAPQVQQMYNEHKGVIDQFNRARLLYERICRDDNTNNLYCRAFQSFFITNGFNHYVALFNGSADAGSIPQLEYRKAGLDAILSKLGIVWPPVPPPTTHWPSRATGSHRRCTADGCERKISSICLACGKDVLLCRQHLDERHLQNQGHA